MYLNDIVKTKEYKIKDINTDELMKRRLYDLGIIDGVKIKLLYISPSKNIKAYLIKNSIISLRNKDASLIEVYDD